VKSKRTIAAVIVSALLLALFIAAYARTGDAAKKRAKAGPADVAKAAQDANQFAIDLFNKNKSKKGNNLISPYSLHTALTMLYAGTGGETAKQLEKAMRYTLPQDKLHPALAGLMDGLNARCSKGGCGLHVANRLWVDKRYILLDSFTELNSTYYGAGVGMVDFQNDPEGALKEINSWTSENTAGAIEAIFPKGGVAAYDRIMLTNAVYLKGRWASRFDIKDTSDASFLIPRAGKQDVPMMWQKGTFGYGEIEGAKLLAMPFESGDLSMLVILPDKLYGLSPLENSLTLENLDKWIADMRETEVDVLLPRFKTAKKFETKHLLLMMGVTDLFTQKNVDFSRMSKAGDLFIRSVPQSVVIEVNEDGAEAAAVTAVTATKNGGHEFHAVHTFLYIIRDNKTGLIIFMGRLTDPRAPEKTKK